MFGTTGGAVTLLYVLLITVLWLSITGRLGRVRAAMQLTPGASGDESGSGSNGHYGESGIWIPKAEGSEPSMTLPTRTTGDPDVDDFLNQWGITLQIPMIPKIEMPRVGTPPLSGPIVNNREPKLNKPVKAKKYQ